MKSLLICPVERPAVAVLAERHPLSLAPLLGRSLIEYWLEHLAASGARCVRILASDRPHQVRAAVGDGSRWGLQIEVVPESRELTLQEARARYRRESGSGWLPAPNDVVVLDHLPGLPEHRVLSSYAGWFAGLQVWLPRAGSSSRVGVREIQPGVFAGLHTRVSPTARLHAPGWLGEHVYVGDHVVLGPTAVLEDRVYVEAGARVTHSGVGPDTFVGQGTSLDHSLAYGNTLIDWQSGSCLCVPDPFLLCGLGDRERKPGPTAWCGRLAAVLTMLLTSPLAAGAILRSNLRKERAFHPRTAVRPTRALRRPPEERFTYFELAGARGWLRRWPQLWSIVQGDLAWVGNRPLSPGDAAQLANDFERLWLTAPAGLFSLADVEGSGEALNEETCAHASYYAVRANARLNGSILARALFQALALGITLPNDCKEWLAPFGRPLLRPHPRSSLPHENSE
jgi:hypothetical protein